MSSVMLACVGIIVAGLGYIIQRTWMLVAGIFVLLAAISLGILGAVG